MATFLMPPARQRGWANSGVPAANCLLYTYEAGTTTPKATYQDAAATIPHTNPIVLDAKGEALIYWEGNYRIDLRTAAGVQITGYPVDDFETPMMSSSLDVATASSTIKGTWFGGVVAYLSALGESAGSSLIGFIQAGAGSLIRSIQSKLRDTVSLRDFGCVIDGVTDDTAAVAACLTYAKANGLSVWHPGGVCRVTSGFTQATNYHNLIIRGTGPVDEPYLGDAGASTFLLDSTDPASFFLSITGTSALTLEGLTFKCEQYVLDRAFIKSSAGLYHHNVQNCTFTAVERPFVYLPGGYFQNASYRNVMFLNSGTFHSEGSDVVDPSSLIGTLFTLDNVNHEGSIPVNTEMRVCNLQGIRQIWATNFLLEGFLPAAGWTVLRLNNPYDSYYTRHSMGMISNFHSEWTVNAPLYVVDQVGGMVKFSSLVGITATSKYKISNLGRVIVEDTSFSGNLDEPTTFFLKENSQCIVDFVNCSARTLDTTIVGYNHHNTQYASITDGSGQVILSNQAAQEIYRWNGGIFDGDQVVYTLAGGTTSVYSTEAVYGRKLVITPNAGALSAKVRIKAAAMLAPGDQVMVACRAKLPTFAAGLWAFQLDVDLATKITLYFDSTKSGQFVDVIIPFVLLTTPDNMAIGFNNGTTAGVATDLEVYSIAIYHGNSMPRRELPCYPENTISWSNAAPTTGTWKRGDIVWNDTPSAAGIPGWICTTAGTPGTWKAMAVLAA